MIPFEQLISAGNDDTTSEYITCMIMMIMCIIWSCYSFVDSELNTERNVYISGLKTVDFDEGPLKASLHAAEKRIEHLTEVSVLKMF